MFKRLYSSEETSLAPIEHSLKSGSLHCFLLADQFLRVQVLAGRSHLAALVFILFQPVL